MQAVKEEKDGIEEFEKQQQRARIAQISRSSERLLSGFIRRASARSERIGKARLFMESVVRRAEWSLIEKKRAQVASVSCDSKRKMSGALAEEHFHTPGTLLTSKEFAFIYQESRCEEMRRSVDCNKIPYVDFFRAANGTCNNLGNPVQGSSFTALTRILEPFYEDLDGINQLREFIQSRNNGSSNPSAHLTNTTIVCDHRPTDKRVLSHLVMQWGQFIDHDLALI